MERLPAASDPPVGEVWVSPVMIEFVGWRWALWWRTADGERDTWTAETVVAMPSGQTKLFEGSRLPVMAYRGSASFSGEHGNRVALIVGEDRA